MKGFKKFAFVAAAALLAAASWSEPALRSAEEFDAEAEEYKEYWLKSMAENEAKKDGVARYIEDLKQFAQAHPQCILTSVDLIEMYFKTRAEKDAIKTYKKAKDMILTVPDTAQGRFSKAKFYRLSSEINLYVFKKKAEGIKLAELNYDGLAKDDAELCAQNDRMLGAQAFYNLANYYYAGDRLVECSKYYLKAFECDSDFLLASQNDLRRFYSACGQRKRYGDLASFYDLYLCGANSAYSKDLGTAALSAYEKAKKTDKAVLVSVLDYEGAAKGGGDGEKLLALLNKNFKKDKKAAPCIAFIQKFYDKDASLLQADVDALPQDAQNFLPVRYMFDMKNSSDVTELREKYDGFFKTCAGYCKRLYEKAEKSGNKEAMAEIEKLL